MTAVFSFAALHLHVLNLFHNLATWHDVQSLNQIKYLAIGVCVLSTIGAAVFGAMAFHMKDGKFILKNLYFLNR